MKICPQTLGPVPYAQAKFQLDTQSTTKRIAIHTYRQTDRLVEEVAVVVAEVAVIVVVVVVTVEVVKIAAAAAAAAAVVS